MPAGKVNRGTLCGPRVQRVQRVQKERLTGLRPVGALPFGQRVVFAPLRGQKGIELYNPCASLRRDCHEVAQGCTTQRVEVLLYAVGTAPSREALIKSLSAFILEFLCNARNGTTRIASYLRRLMTQHWIKIHMKFDSANESVLP